MSQYPHGGYGQQPVGYAPQYPYPYAYQAPGTYPPPVYGSPTQPREAAGLYATAQNAFNQNASRIPGLGIAATPKSASPYNPAGASATWNQIQTPSFPAGAPGSAPQPPVGPRALFAQGSRETFPSAQQPAPSSTQLPDPDELQKRSSDDMEEGELSEGQFEDLYEPREPASRSVNLVPPHKDASNTDLSRGASVVDTPEAGFYATEEEEVVTARAGNHTDAARDRSGSYSPYLSPREIQSDRTPNVRTPNDGYLSPQARQLPQGTTTTKVNEYIQSVPGLQHATSRGSNSYAANNAPSPNPHAMQGSMEKQCTFKTLDEAKKEAQKAILRLWPLGVKYQHYLDEGFDEKVIKSLFDALHLDISTGRPKEPEPPTAPAQDLGAKTHDQATPSSKSPSADAQPLAQQTKAKAMDKSEERKDRIARLLAAKAGKAAPAQTNPNPPAATTPSGPSAPAGTLRTREDKELLLQQKMEALRKSREARAQKVTSDNKDTPSVVPNGNETSVSALPRPVPDLVASPEPKSTSISATSSASPAKHASPEEAPQESASILGLFSSTPQPIEPTSQRKRPVAMDFVDYPSMVGTLKRPFGQGRKDSSLVIDVSDGSDEEMDIDMDEDSPIEPTSNIQRADSSARPGPSIRDFPPLTDMSQRQYSSPAPSIKTPPTGPSNGKKRQTELDRKEREIQEMRRKIAEAEAKRLAKKASGGSQTPNPPAITPPAPRDDGTSRPAVRRVSSLGDTRVPDGPSAQLLAEAVSATLPKPSEIRNKDGLRAERRGRISSLDLPRVDGTLHEKMSRLKRLQEEQAKLQAEIEASLAEKNKLADELNQLDEETPAESSQEDGQLVEDGPDETGAVLPESEMASPAKTSTSPSEEAGPVHDTPPQEEAAPRPMPVTQDRSEPLADATKVLGQDPQHGNEDNEPTTGATSSDAVPGPVPSPSPQSSVPDQEPVTSGSPAPSEGGQLAAESANPDTAVNKPTPAEVPQGENKTTSEGYEPPEPIEPDTADHMTVTSSPFSPAPAADPSTLQNADDAPRDTTKALPLPTQISSAAQPREAIQEMEDKISSSEVPTALQPNLESTFSPYESPLQNFRAYRFHRDFRSTVAGGLKSLTFSNRIDPNKAICPFDLSGQPCPQGGSCQFQHFESIAVPDDQILLELGKADDYTGEQKNRFIQGLRELLQNFRANKIRDFETIANGIIEFRSRFLGDESKILQLEGVAI